MFLSRNRNWKIPWLAALWLAAALQAATPTALDRYVAEPDPAFRYQRVGTYTGAGYLAYVLEMDSQNWRSPAEVDRTTWKHWLTILVPGRVDSTTGLLFINGGSNNGGPPGPLEFFLLGSVAAQTRTVVADLRMVPNQPLTFAGESAPRSEDAILAYSFDKYLRTGDEKWPALLPMTKAAVRAMDVITDFVRQPEAGGRTVDRFVVAGGSKRGWTAWLTAAVDSRVVGVIPLVIDLLNLEPSFFHHWQAYGFWAPAIQDYEKIGFMAWIGSEESRSLLKIIDPFEYRDRLTMPKYIVNAAGDEFFLPDSSQFYFDSLPGQKYLRYVPNTGHSLEASDALNSAAAFYQALITGAPLPRFSWQMPAEGGIIVNAQDTPTAIVLWQATNAAARDFRAVTLGPNPWTGTPLGSAAPGRYEASVPRPPQGWTAYFVELTYPVSPFLLKVTTPLRVVPDTLPFRPPAATVLAASGKTIVAAEAIASAYGQGLTDRTQAAAALPLPEALAGISVSVRDSTGVARLAPLFFASPLQINYQIPAGTAPGVALVEVLRGVQRVTAGSAIIEPVAPGLFSANQNGKGVAAAVAIIVWPDDSRSEQLLYDPAVPAGSRVPVPVDLGPEGTRVFLALFGTGMAAARGATATVGGEPVGVVCPSLSASSRSTSDLCPARWPAPARWTSPSPSMAALLIW